MRTGAQRPNEARTARRAPRRPGPWLCSIAAPGAVIALALALLAPGAAEPAERPTIVLVSSQPESPPGADESDGGVECVLLLRDGSEVSGILADRDEERVYVRIGGIETPFDRDRIAEIRFLEAVESRYERLRRALDDDDIEGRVLLAQWLRERERYRLALTEVEGVLELEPFNPRARQMRTWLNGQIEMLEKRREREAEGDADRGSVEITAESARLAREAERMKFPLLSRDEVNLIRVYEVSLDDPPRMLIGRDVIQRLMEENAASDLIPATAAGREALMRAPPHRVLELMFRLQARDLYSQVRVLEDPESMRRFKREVHAAWFINACASARCHGGEQAGRLWLHDKSVNSDQTAYTNFLILDQFRLADGTPMINWAEPARSPMLQMALPEAISLYPHPEIGRGRGARGFRPVFRSTEDRRFQQGVEWIESMYRPRPDYRIDYAPPVPEGVKHREDAGLTEDEQTDR